MEFKKPFISDDEGAKLRAEYIDLFNKYIVPAYHGADQLLEWIKGSDFFIAPASTMYHMSCRYGLLKHSLNVYKRLVKFVTQEYGEENIEKELGVDKSGLALIALCHDLCKANCYITEMRNVKDETGTWVKEPYYKYSPAFEYGHGSKSVMIIQNFIQGLDLNILSSIRFHMYGGSEYGNAPFREDIALRACEDMNIVYWTQVADAAATYLDEKREMK